jgi:hypothetical protein
MNLSRLLIIHAIITLAAGIVLIAAPELIPQTVNIRITKEQYLVCYLLGGAEIALAFLSFFARELTDLKSLRLISVTFIVFHAATAMVELLAFMSGTSEKVLVNVLLRQIFIVLFWYYGIKKQQHE